MVDAPVWPFARVTGRVVGPSGPLRGVVGAVVLEPRPVRPSVTLDDGEGSWLCRDFTWPSA